MRCECITDHLRDKKLFMPRNLQNSYFLQHTDHWAQALLSPFRHTLQHSITWSGVGVHSAQVTKVSVYPYHPRDQEQYGVIFCGYPLTEWSLSQSAYATSLSHPKIGQKKMTEHLFAALYAAGINDVKIEVKGEELPILDGSAWSYLKPLEPVYTQSKEKPTAKVPRNWTTLPQGLTISWLESQLQVLSIPGEIERLSDSECLPLQVSLHLNLPPLEDHSFHLLSIDDLYRRIIPAKTFGFLQDEQRLKSLSLIQGVSYENTRIYDELGQAINPPHIPDEAAAHKILDFLGDLYRLPHSLKGRIYIERGSHELNHRLVSKMMQNEVL